MKLKCVMCGRSMERAAFEIKGMAIGPKCGIRAGFSPELAYRKPGWWSAPAVRQQQAVRDGDTLSLFDEVAA